jgi:hypothetical protein
MRSAAFPVTKRLAEFDVAASSIPPSTFDHLASLEWIRAAENVCLIGPAGTGKSHMLVALGVAAVEAGHKVATSPRPNSSKLDVAVSQAHFSRHCREKPESMGGQLPNRSRLGRGVR